MYKVRTLGGFALMFSVLTMAVAVVDHSSRTGAPLVPALNSYWIKIHVVAAISGSSLFALGGILTILYLVQDRAIEAGGRPCGGSNRRPSWAAPLDVDAPHDLLEPAPIEPMVRGGRRIRSDAAVGRDARPVAYRVIAFAFPIWTFAVIAGAIWAQEAWGRYWGWDPKETWSFITWVDLRGVPARARDFGLARPARRGVALVGFVSLLITYYAVNLWIVGLHSYGGFLTPVS